jgi:pantoate--beta-alanine ligase
VDLVFAPAQVEVYPYGQPAVRVDPGLLGEDLEGGSRPGFFEGVLTVVMKLFQLVRPDLAFFGEKDYQQLTLIRRMVRDLDVPVEVVGVPTVREPDGLALSSRNRYLSAAEREAALLLSAALREGAAAAEAGLPGEAVIAAGRRLLDDESSGVRLDYLALADPDLEPGPESGPARLLVAAWVGSTRLIDNLAIELNPQSLPS